jgi:hypothetical protein
MPPRGNVLDQVFDPLSMMASFGGLPIPDPITFVIGDVWLAKPQLYPRQATFLKILFLRDDLFTEYDHMVIAEWVQMFKDTNSEEEEKEDQFNARTKGIQPDIYERIGWCKEHGCKWFRECILAVGRRGSKGYLSALAMSYVLWNYLALGNPQEHYGIVQSKQMEVMIFAGKRDQAKVHLWRDLHDVITESECFTSSFGRNYVSQDAALLLSVYAPFDEIRMRRQAAKGISSAQDMATFQIMPKESNPLAARGGAGFIFGFDEAAHVKTTGMTREFGEVYNAAKPALDQFGADSFTCLPSSTWEMTGMFYQLWVNSLENDPGQPGEPLFPNKLMLQLSSWDPYKDWERAQDIPLFPEGYQGDLGEYEHEPHPRLPALKGAIQAYDDEMRREEFANPDTFAVERRSDWATSLEAYLNRGKVDEIFRPWEGRQIAFGPPELSEQARGPLSIAYVAHGDPATVDHRFGYAVGHAEPDEQGMLHAVLDLVKYWEAKDFPDHAIDYDIVTDWIFDHVITKFQPTDVSFDPYNVPSTVHRLNKKIRAAHLQKSIMVYQTAPTLPLNWSRWECTKAAINLGLVHCYPFPELATELKFLEKPEGVNKVVPPDSGPCTTNDIADAFSHVVQKLLGEQLSAYLGQDLRNARPGAAMGPAQTDPFRRFDPDEAMMNPYAGALAMQGHGALARGMRPRTGTMPASFVPSRQASVRRSRHRN